MNIVRASVLVTVGVASISVAIACGGDDAAPANDGRTSAGDGGARGLESTGQTCTAPSQCYGGVDGGADGGGIAGDVTCLTKIPSGYCTHTCTNDSQCCAAPGECGTDVKQVCSPFENQGAQYCFLSCEDEDIARAIAADAEAGLYDGGVVDGGSREDAYCASYAGASTSCRSSGGGSKNRKVCIPKG